MQQCNSAGRLTRAARETGAQQFECFCALWLELGRGRGCKGQSWGLLSTPSRSNGATTTKQPTEWPPPCSSPAGSCGRGWPSARCTVQALSCASRHGHWHWHWRWLIPSACSWPDAVWLSWSPRPLCILVRCLFTDGHHHLTSMTTYLQKTKKETWPNVPRRIHSLTTRPLHIHRTHRTWHPSSRCPSLVPCPHPQPTSSTAPLEHRPAPIALAQGPRPANHTSPLLLFPLPFPI
jgi:hypothetical protein